MAKLGDRVKDRVSGVKGIVVGKSNFLYGCTRLCVQPEESKDGKPAEGFWIDEPQAEVIKSGVIEVPQPEDPQVVPARRPGGPRPDAQRSVDAKR